jgi:hypothetical protein
MPDRSSRHGLPDDWRYGSHAARGQHSAGRPADGYEPGSGGSHRAGFGSGPADGYGAGNTEAPQPRTDGYGVGNTEPLQPRTDAYGAGNTEALQPRTDAYGAGKTEALQPRTDAYGAEGAGGFGGRPGAGAADRFGNADPFGDGRSYGDAESYGDASSAEIGAARPGDAAGGKGFLVALFDFGFTSFVTPKVIKVLYTLITIGTVLSALVFTIIVFKANVAFGVATLVVGDPLFILIVLAIYRVILEFFVVTSRVAEDIRALRERGDLR